ncbi:Calcium channel YVC1 [Tolypocladium capitatum]|uniref:Calcium channel YVC1 n=1 Tax=Tolypocladium capitatum TaxID=45235 RepID=A0A2K3QQX1_9HYPO|nr:Calcium channel YVC1 [Tolypocladium capitatum]
MFSSLLRRPRNGSRHVDIRDGSLSPSQRPPPRLQFSARMHATADFTEAEDDDEDDSNDEPTNRSGDEEQGQAAPAPRAGAEDDADEADEADDAGEDGGQKALPVLPLFSATHLDSLPIYSITHAIRIIVSARTETTLTWEQLRSPQVSQFLVKPMQQQIRTQHFSRATLYALMANCLQFTKEGQRYAANAGNSNTRAKVCELLALKLLKEYTTRELIDALAYDFYPLQGLPGVQPPYPSGATNTKAKQAVTASRTSTLEVAIRASAKHFLAHPVVIQQLEAIWNGAITFYSSADSLHREAPPNPFQAINGNAAKPDPRTPLLGSLPPKQGHFHVPSGRRTVMLYDPRQASMLKLSRLRVPRYRSFLSTLSLAVLIGLFLSVLAQRSVQISGLELVFWFWSAGFMLDELVGFNEQGFALYIMSFWNIFDLGILVLLIAYYCMRAYGVFLVDPHHWNDMAYDVLAANAILLLPRIFSVLDHYQYFSQLLIAFRLMAVDLAAVFVLVLIMCSGFYVFFTLSASANDGGDVAYKIFQILMGFTPAAWDVWPQYNWLARILMMMFLIICHFLVVTILITVLTNSFMTIASNATEEHQFLFAINTISMVKNDALFSYIAPSNIFAWLLMPLRYCMPLKHFVWLNRTIIKVTHFPVLFCIYLYERFWLAPSMYEPTDLVENHGRSRPRTISFRDPVERTAMFSPNLRVREESVAGFHKDRALEEVFWRLPESATLRTQRRNERRKTQTAIRNWMDQNDDAGVPLSNWPTLDSRALPDWQRRLSVGWDRPSHFRQVSDVRSTASDPAEFVSNHGASFSRGQRSRLEAVMPEYKDQTDADGDDELLTNDEDEDDAGTNADRSHQYAKHGVEEEDYFTTPMVARSAKLASSHGSSAKALAPSPRQGNQGRGMHSRTLSTNTILYNPEELPQAHSSSPKSPPRATQGRKIGAGGRSTGANTPAQAVRRSSPRRTAFAPSSHPRPPTVPPRGMTETGGVSRTAMLSLDPRDRLRGARRLSSVDLSILSDQFGHEDPNVGMAGSFQTQMAMAMMKDHRLRVAGGVDVADRDRMGRLVLARMKTLEESFAEVIKEMRDLKNMPTEPHTRRNSSTEEAKGTGIDSSGYDRPKGAKGDATPKKGYGKRPASRRSMKEGKVGMAPRRDARGKGKEIASSPTSDEGEVDDSFQLRGSSM